jgi:hypothetical protein
MCSIVYRHLIMLGVPILTGMAHSLVADEGVGLQMGKQLRIRILTVTDSQWRDPTQ